MKFVKYPKWYQMIQTLKNNFLFQVRHFPKCESSYSLKPIKQTKTNLAYPEPPTLPESFLQKSTFLDFLKYWNNSTSIHMQVFWFQQQEIYPVWKITSHTQGGLMTCDFYNSRKQFYTFVSTWLIYLAIKINFHDHNVCRKKYFCTAIKIYPYQFHL